MKRCRVCDKILTSLKAGKRHFREEHAGEIETPEEYLERVESEQRDFAGEEPSTEGHNPEYLAEKEREDTRRTTLFEHQRTEDSTLQEHTDSEDQE